MRYLAAAAVLYSIFENPVVSTAVSQVKWTETEKTVHVFHVMTWIVFALSIFKIFVAHNNSPLNLDLNFS